MNKFKNWIKSHWPTKRRLMQLYFGLLFNANLKGFVEGAIYKGNTKVMCAPGINCYSCPGAIGACPLGSLQGALSKDHTSLFYVGGILLLYCVMFGRMICGWLCPFGLIQELVYKIRSPKIKKSPVTRALSYIKFIILPIFAIAVPIATASPAFCKYICPAGVVEGGIPLLSYLPINEVLYTRLEHLFSWKFMLTIAIMIGCIFLYRLFCRFVCPLGALYGLFNRISLFGIKLNRDKCVDCNKCISHCKMDIRRVGDPECISCGECVSVCPTQAIQWKVGGIALKPNEVAAQEEVPAKPKKNKRLVVRIVAAVLMLAVLGGTVAYHWYEEANQNPVIVLPEDPNGDGDNAEKPARGGEVGNLCYTANLEIVDANGNTGKTIDPTATGKITVVNFWYTSCTPCKEEMPYFSKLADEYSDSVTVVTVCSYITKEMPTFIAENYPDSKIVFAKDFITDGSENEGLRNGLFYQLFGTVSTYPCTVILDENGTIVYKLPHTLTYEDLVAKIESMQ